MFIKVKYIPAMLSIAALFSFLSCAGMANQEDLYSIEVPAEKLQQIDTIELKKNGVN